MTGITLIAVAAGGACGALLRYGAVLVTGAGIFGFAGPMATLTVNICGSAIMGLVAGGLAAGVVMPEPLRLFIAVGFLGALTTFSTFALAAYLPQCQICIGNPLTSPSDLKGPGTSKLDWRYFEHNKIDRNEL